MIETIAGPLVVSVDTHEDLLDGQLFPEEEVAVAYAVDKRRSEYITARICARRAMTQLGVPPSPVASGTCGEPLWPPGLVGSITHCPGYRGVVLGRAREVAAVGIDAEQNSPMPADILDAISLPRERVWVHRLGLVVPSIVWGRLLFSAKEAVYKAWFPLTRHSLDFEDVLIEATAEGDFNAYLLAPEPLLRTARIFTLTGRWLVQDGLVLTTVVISASGHDGTRPSSSP